MTVLPETVHPVADPALEQAVRARLDSLTKPPGSLGRLEELALRYCLCRGDPAARIERCKVLTFAGDHGITEEKITPFPTAVTRQMVLNMAAGGAAVSVMCREAGVEYGVVDVGVAGGEFDEVPGLLRRKVGEGTANFARGPAMTAGARDAAIAVGVEASAVPGIDLFGIGEMGIGNTSSASALYSLLLDSDPTATVGPGTGSHGDLLERKRRIVADAVTRHRTEWDGSPLDALRRVGGYEIAAMTGLALGAAARRVPVVVDGFISSAAALCAVRVQPHLADYLFFAHASAEPFHREFLAREGIRPILDLDMRLGEGTGAVPAMQVIRQAMACYHHMATFSSAGLAGGAGEGSPPYS